jgi:hypothetical protein
MIESMILKKKPGSAGLFLFVVAALRTLQGR